tara:strand:- start:1873 stop:2061 length:189 start_codon:yes stop_codon:yes gene_type:complete
MQEQLPRSLRTAPAAKSRLAMADLCSCKICISAIHGGQRNPLAWIAAFYLGASCGLIAFFGG